MEMKNLQEKKNPFLDRTEYMIEIQNDSTPSEADIKDALGKDKDLTVIRKINANFGRRSFVVDLVVYDSAEAKEKVQVIPKKIKKKMKEEKKKAEEEAKKAKEEKKKAEEEVRAQEENAEKTEEVAEEIKDGD